MLTRQAIVTEALSWQGTPWHHHQCVKGGGVDCVQFLYGVGKNVGFIPADFVIPNYEPLARGSFLVRHLNRWLTLADSPSPGSILLIAFGGLDTHVGIVISNTEFIHACARRKKVTIAPIKQYRAIYDVPGVIDG